MVARELIAAVLGVGFGLFLVAFPQAFVRSWTAGRGRPDPSRGEYGADGSTPEKWLWVVRGAGVLVAAIGIGFGASLYL
ncbi:hypothetical protein [Halorientalis salina]|uniref:hypothetical protein n=1 Tax=Halorientalis salina TaxID=2932266 RepID=UPI0010ACE8DA|nr:hypothetical protein [Halorientalis salina]